MGTYIHGQCPGTRYPCTTNPYERYVSLIDGLIRGRELIRLQLCLRRLFLIRPPSTIPMLDPRPHQTLSRTHPSLHRAAHLLLPPSNHHQRMAEHQALNSFLHRHYRPSLPGPHIQRLTRRTLLGSYRPLARAYTKSTSINLKVVDNHGDDQEAIYQIGLILDLMKSPTPSSCGSERTWRLADRLW